ncbi:MAG: 8-amino-7-oxononanoate synthase [Planctomycetes bacterium]|nr:8-amino-7-oxononanoate synthase [Planctomycetota bacterium]
MNLDDRWTTILEELRAAGRYRRLDAPRGLDLSSNDYLGHGRKPPPDCKLPGSGLSSRLVHGQHPTWDKVESELAGWHACEAALVFTSGYVANEGLLATILEPGDFVASDELNHASIVDGIRLGRAEKFIFRHNDLEHLKHGLLAARQRQSAGRQLFVVTESLFGMDGDLTPLAEIVEICQRFQAHLIVDEAHATGCFGPEGAGRIAEAGLRQHVLATVHTGGKALGVAGAYVCGSPRLRELLINRCRHFIYTTALPAALSDWWLHALARTRADDDGRRRLHEVAGHFRRELARHGVDAAGTGYIVPIVVGADAEATAAAARLQALGFDIRAIRPPSVPAGTARLRVSIHADHDMDVLTLAAAAIAHVLTPTPLSIS